MASKYVLEVELTGFAARLAIVYKGKRDLKEDTKVWGKALERTGVSLLKWRRLGESRFFSVFDMLSLRFSLNIWLEIINR